MSEEPKRLYLSQQDKKLGGVCGGIAAYLGMDATVIRILWIVLTIASVGIGVLAYLVVWLVAPKAPYAAVTAMAPQT